MAKSRDQIDSTAGVAVEDHKESAERLYWMGALPASGKFKFGVPTLEPSEIENESGEYMKYVDTTAHTLWCKHNPPIWRGKCPYYQNLTVTWMEFVAYSGRQVRGADGNNRTIVLEPFPGLVAKLSKESLDAIVKHAQATFYREPNGKGSENASKNVKLVNTVASKPPATYNAMDPNARPIKDPTDLTFNQKRDTPIAECVYIVPLDVDPDSSPEGYSRLIPTMEDFLANPPKSLADALKAGELS